VTGTKLLREWDGVEHTVTVLKDGFDWQGRKFKSLSAVARGITGTRWNGYRFFGLRERKRERERPQRLELVGDGSGGGRHGDEE
jgi:hypothetical protein